MPNVAAADSVIRLMQEAAEANRSDACRVGALIELPAQGDVLVAGDLHGNRENYQRIVEMAALSRQRQRHLVIHEIIHGLTRTADGCDLSYQVMEMAARLKTFFPDRVHILMGNHDLGDILQLDIRKLGESALHGMLRALAVAYDLRKDDVHKAYHEFLGSLPIAVRTQTGIFITHSVPEPRYHALYDETVFRQPLKEEDLRRDGFVYPLLWGRDFSQPAADSFAARVGADLLICGHQPVPEGFAVPNTRQIILDSKDDQACVALIPLDRRLTHNELVQQIRRLHTNQPVV
jgi:hypothetical protein